MEPRLATGRTLDRRAPSIHPQPARHPPGTRRGPAGWFAAAPLLLASRAEGGAMASPRTVLVLVGPEYEDLEVWYPKLRLEEAGFAVRLAGMGERRYQGKHGYPCEVDGKVAEVPAAGLAGVVAPGGWAPGGRPRRRWRPATSSRRASRRTSPPSPGPCCRCSGRLDRAGPAPRARPMISRADLGPSH